MLNVGRVARICYNILLMISEMVLSPERLATDVARVRPFVRVRPYVYEQIVRLAELPVAVRADVSLLGLAARRGGRRLALHHGHGSHLLLDVPGQSHGPDVALHLTGRLVTPVGERARMLTESRPDRVHVQRREVVQQTVAAAAAETGCKP